MDAVLKSLGIEWKQLVVNIVGFLLLIWLLKRYMFGPVGDFLEQRRQRIAQDLADAESAKQAAAAELATLQAGRAEKLAAVDQEVAQLKAAGLADANGLKEKARNETGNMVRQAEAEIARKTQDALVGLRVETAAIAVGMCEKLLRNSLTAERHAALVDQFIEDIEKAAG